MIETRALPPGTSVAKDWRLVRVLGSGGFGVTYEALNTSIGERAALKEYMPASLCRRIEGSTRVVPADGQDGAIFANGMKSFIKEAEALKRLHHASIVRVMDFFEANGTSYMALAFEEGGTLKDWLVGLGRRPNQDEVDRILWPLTEAMIQVHALFVLHLDIKPDNIMMRSDGTPVLIDFGSCKNIVASGTRALNGPKSLTFVSDGYTPLEQYAQDGNPILGPWTDVYALAATVYEAVAGRRPHAATSRFSEDRHRPLADYPRGPIDDTAPTCLDHLGAGWRDAFLAGVDRGLSLRRADRPQSMVEFRMALGVPDPLAERLRLAAAEWATLKDITDPALLEQFARTYASTYFGGLAAARIEALQRDLREIAAAEERRRQAAAEALTEQQHRAEQVNRERMAEAEREWGRFEDDYFLGSRRDGTLRVDQLEAFRHRWPQSPHEAAARRQIRSLHMYMDSQWPVSGVEHAADRQKPTSPTPEIPGADSSPQLPEPNPTANRPEPAQKRNLGNISIVVNEVKYGLLVQESGGAVHVGTPTITARTRDMPSDVANLCLPDLLVPADANPIQMVEGWAQERGGLVILPVVRAGTQPHDRLWTLIARIRPYLERGVGKGGRPTTMVTAWPVPEMEFARVIPSLAPALAEHMLAEPELANAASSERMARAPITIPGREPAVATIGGIPRPALLLLDALRRGRPSRWTKATFIDEQAFLDCLAIVYRLIPPLRGGVQPRALLSASSGIAIGAEAFLISYVRDGALTNDEKAKLPAAWETYLSRSPGEAIADLVARAEVSAQRLRVLKDTHHAMFGHQGAPEGEWAAEGLVEALRYYGDPGYVRPNWVRTDRPATTRDLDKG